MSRASSAALLWRSSQASSTKAATLLSTLPRLGHPTTIAATATQVRLLGSTSRLSFARYGPNLQEAGPPITKRVICLRCKQLGHMAIECPQPRRCYNCNAEGHISRDCPKALQPQTCHNCGQIGHWARECTSPRLCHGCGKAGHQLRDCPAT